MLPGYDPAVAWKDQNIRSRVFKCRISSLKSKLEGMTAAAAFTAYHVGQRKIGGAKACRMPPSLTTGVKSIIEGRQHGYATRLTLNSGGVFFQKGRRVGVNSP
jgi:hypothetical protein